MRCLLRMVVMGTLAVTACTSERAREAEPRAEPAGAAPPASAAVPTEAELLDAAQLILAFLDGSAQLDPALVADSVTLRVAPEGGGATRTLTGPERANRAAWRAGDHELAPPAGSTTTTLRVNRHFDCFETTLAERGLAELDTQPHVGAKREPPGADSCLQVWNLTLVFTPGATPPRLIAAVYDQFEW